MHKIQFADMFLIYFVHTLHGTISCTCSAKIGLRFSIFPRPLGCWGKDWIRDFPSNSLAKNKECSIKGFLVQ